MRYSPELLDILRSGGTVTVTGPQRSGTRIATRILAADLGAMFIGEERYGVGVHEGILERYMTIAHCGEPVVIHAPTLAPVAHYLPGMVVCMRRQLVDIAASQERIGWAYERYMLDRYFVRDGPLASIVYAAWDNYQAPMLSERAVELEYDSLVGHPFWLSKDKRAGFSPHQTALTPPP